MAIFNFDDLSKQAKFDYNTLYNIIYHCTNCNGEISFEVPLCLTSDNKVALTEKNFIFFESVLSELKLYGWYTIVENRGKAFDDVKGDFYTVSVTVSNKKIEPPKNLVIKTFDYSDVDTTKLLKRDGKAEKQKTKKNAKAKAKIKKEAEKTSKELEEKTTEVETLKKEIAKKDEQLNKKAIAEFNDDALFTIANCVEVLIKKHCLIPADFDFASFENDLFKVITSHWDLKVLDK